MANKMTMFSSVLYDPKWMFFCSFLTQSRFAITEKFLKYEKERNTKESLSLHRNVSVPILLQRFPKSIFSFVEATTRLEYKNSGNPAGLQYIDSLSFSIPYSPVTFRVSHASYK